MESVRAEPAVNRIGRAAWSIVGVIVLLSILVCILAAISELVLPFVLATMLAAAFHPLARRLQRKGMPPAAAALVVLTGLVLAIAAVVLITVKAVAQESGDLAAQFDQATEEVADTADSVGVEQDEIDEARQAFGAISGMLRVGLLTALVSGVGAVIGAIASVILGMLIGYYILKDGPDIARWLVQQFPERSRPEVDAFLHASVRSVRSYWAGRTVLAAIIAAVIAIASLVMGLPYVGAIAIVNFVGGYIPYIGAFVGGGLAVLLALADGGIVPALVMLGVVMVANLLLENVLEPKVMGDRLKIHPLVVLMATTLGGVVGGIVGLLLAVPVTVILLDALNRLRRSGALEAARERAEPVLREVAAGGSNPAPP